MTREELIKNTENEREFLENTLNKLIATIGPIPIANRRIMPFGWRKSAKGRTVWRIVEEIISQHLELHAHDLGLDEALPADSEVGVYDFKFIYNRGTESYVNIKSSVKGGKRNKDDISKAESIEQFYNGNLYQNLYVATFVIDFKDDMTIELSKCIVMPITWIPDIYVNPSNNGNLQSADYKNLSLAVKRTNEEFFEEFEKEYAIAKSKKSKKIRGE